MKGLEDMEHPTTERWMAWLYGEASPGERADCEAHLAVCPECRQQVEEWRSASAALDLDQATLTIPRGRPLGMARWVGWGLAASVLLLLGFAAGRIGGDRGEGMRKEWAQWKVEVERREQERNEALMQDVARAAMAAGAEETRRWLGEVTRQWAEARAEDRKEWDGIREVLANLEDRREADAIAVRAGLLGLARFTGTGFEQTRSQLQQLGQVPVSEPVPRDP